MLGKGEAAELACGGLRGPWVWSGLPGPSSAPAGLVGTGPAFNDTVLKGKKKEEFFIQLNRASLLL